jgi:hypothetical protein
MKSRRNRATAVRPAADIWNHGLAGIVGPPRQFDDGRNGQRARQPTTGRRERSDQQCLEMKTPGTFPANGTRASANTSGPDLDQAFGFYPGPDEIAEPLGSATNEENLFLLPDRFSRDENSIQPLT